jgi:sodium/bile acid cotransporter 7
MSVRSLRLDPFLTAMMGTVLLASFLPVSGSAASIVQTVTDLAIALLFFLHGAKLSRAAIRAGLGSLRVHVLVLLASFLLFPLLGVALRAALGTMVDPAILAGLVFLTLLPSTVQSSIAFTGIAGGNVPAAVCSASISNLVGIALTPLLAALVLTNGSGGAAISGEAVQKIAMQLLLPFAVGHLSRPLVGGFVDRHRKLLGRWDRGSILLVVYSAFSASVVEGLWSRVAPADIAVILLLDGFVLAVMIVGLTVLARRLGFAREDEIVIVFAGSKKSLASGVPIAGALFPAALVGPMILPLMLFHQLQLMVCSALAAWYAAHKTTMTDNRSSRAANGQEPCCE